MRPWRGQVWSSSRNCTGCALRDAYGTDDEESFTGVDKPDTADPGAEPYNVYRYQGKRWDPHTRSYDMGFRDYNPGLNRFMTRDMYNGALADLGLDVDPWTGNRYAFTGGNPISLVDPTGHEPRPWHNPEFDSSTFDYDSYWAAERKASEPTPCYCAGGPESVRTEINWSAVGDLFGGVGAGAIDVAESSTPFGTWALGKLGIPRLSESYGHLMDHGGVERNSDPYQAGEWTTIIGSSAVGGAGAVKAAAGGAKSAFSWVRGLFGKPSGKPSGAGAGTANEAARVLKGPNTDQVPRNLAEQFALGAAREGHGTVIMRNLGDAPRLVANYGDGEWVKMQYVLRGMDSNVTVHYFRKSDDQD